MRDRRVVLKEERNEERMEGKKKRKEKEREKKERKRKEKKKYEGRRKRKEREIKKLMRQRMRRSCNDKSSIRSLSLFILLVIKDNRMKNVSVGIISLIRVTTVKERYWK